MTRIIAGYASGRVLQVPAQHTRPTSARVREAMFSSLQSWNVLTDARVLDLFAGSGALGLEAASRGAASVDLVDVAAESIAICQRNADIVSRSLPSPIPLNVVRSDANRWLTRANGSWDLVFVDPPYAFSEDEISELLAALSSSLVEDAMVVVERATRSGTMDWPPAYDAAREKRYGDTTVWYGWRNNND